MPRPVRSADIAELRAFCAAVELGSLGRAARLLRVSQPALSKRLRMLEALAGGQLLERSSRGVSTTPAGTRLYSEARKLLVQAEAVDELLGGLSATAAPVHLAASHTIAEYVLPAPLVEYETRHDRHLSVELLIANSRVVRDLVRDGRAEFDIAAIGAGDTRDETLRVIPMIEDEVVVGVPPDHPWAQVEEIDPAEFVRTPMVVRDPGADTRRCVEEVAEVNGLRLAPPLAEMGSTSAAKSAARHERAPVLLSRLAVEGEGDGLVVRRVRGMRFGRRFAVLVGGQETLTSSARALMDYLLSATSDS